MPAIAMMILFQVIYFEDSSITNYCIWHQSILVTIKFKVEWYWMHLCTVYQYISTVSAEFSVEKGCIYLPWNRRVKYAADWNDVLLQLFYLHDNTRNCIAFCWENFKHHFYLLSFSIWPVTIALSLSWCNHCLVAHSWF